MQKGILLVCDEGHRLKNARGNQTIAALEQIGATRKLLVTVPTRIYFHRRKRTNLSL
jgi:hypothetical protein